MRSANRIGWGVVALIGAGALGVIANARGEAINAVWVVVAALCVYLIAYRFYARYLARIVGIDPVRPTPAMRHPDGLDFVATDRRVLFGHHFAAIAGAGPLVGPVLAAQMGYLPGMLWILAGVVLAGAVQDFMVLFLSMRRDGRSLGEMIRLEMGAVPGTIALFGAFMIMIIISRGARTDRRAGAGRQSLGPVHRRRDHPARGADGRLYPLDPAGGGSERCRCSASSG